MSQVEQNKPQSLEPPKVVLVTGGAGFIGSHVSERLMARGDKVVVVDEMNDYYDVRLKEANLSYLSAKFADNVVIYRGDICNANFISDVFSREKPTHVCHLAARAGVRASIVDPYIYVHSNIEGTTRLLDLARQYACANFVYASSSSVYGCSEKSILSESDAVEKPVSPYAATKKACELLAYTFHHLYGLNCTGLRFFTVYGPRGRPDMAPFKFIDRVFHAHPIQQYGDGSTSRDYTYIDDIVSGVVAAVDTPLGCEVVNLGNGKPYLLRDFISLVETCVGRKANIEVLPEQPGDVERTCADITKAKALLGYRPQVTFEEGIARTAAWYKEAHKEGLLASSVSESCNDSSSSTSSSTYEEKDTSADAVELSGTKTDASEVGLELSDEENGESRRKQISHVFAVPSPVPIFSASLDKCIPDKVQIIRSRSDGDPSTTNGKRRHSHSRHLHSDDEAPNDKRPRMIREESDLELSSYVEKADRQYKTRTSRILHSNGLENHAHERIPAPDTNTKYTNNNNTNLNCSQNAQTLPRSLSV